MRKTLIAAAVVSAFTSSVALAEVSGNMTLASEYIYRGIAQTNGAPGLQGGFDYAHDSGAYVGLWASNVSWVSGNASLEMDVYGGYKMAIGDLGLDVGVLTYNYPGTNRLQGAERPDTAEVYIGASWQFLSLKYSHTVGSLFGWTKTADDTKTDGSGYLELNVAYDIGSGYTLIGHYGDQSVDGRATAEYADYKLGINKDMGFGTVSLAYSDTDAKGNCDLGEDYCFTDRDAGQDRVLVSFSKSF